VDDVSKPPLAVRPRVNPHSTDIKIDKETVEDLEAEKLDLSLGMLPMPSALLAAAALKSPKSETHSLEPKSPGRRSVGVYMITSPEQLKASATVRQTMLKLTLLINNN
jgi:hypothetical protein